MTATTSLEKLEASAERACGLLKMLANENRLLLLCQLSRGEKCVSELEEITGIRQPTLSQQLGVLREQGLISPRREGKQIYYSVASKEAMVVIQVLYKLYCEEETA